MPSKELKDALSNIIWDACAHDEKPISDSVDEIISTILAALQEPTDEMKRKGIMYTDFPSQCWRAMLAASTLGEQSE